ncbi:mediator of RNA polymerase II transcription subunit 30-like [Oryza brachyantha]|uniref:mediator of RNA polymerase II transcription subunit 30-like n=1 Tax=Oryza brachyantha TaxID=4533 RepID=UPI0007764F7A|nr:mediator of RNA polymerase II transcription subunit 30-like [Oryza brachyantha]
MAAARRRQELAGEGQRHLEEAIAAAFQILTSIDHELSDPALWSSSQHQQQQQDPPAAAGSDAAPGGGRGASPSHGGSLDEARHSYKTAVAALRASITAVSSCRAQEIGPTEDKGDTAEIKKLEDRVSVLRKEIESKNKDVKCLVDHLRDLISDVSMWQSSGI